MHHTVAQTTNKGKKDELRNGPINNIQWIVYWGHQVTTAPWTGSCQKRARNLMSVTCVARDHAERVGGSNNWQRKQYKASLCHGNQPSLVGPGTSLLVCLRSTWPVYSLKCCSWPNSEWTLSNLIVVCIPCFSHKIYIKLLLFIIFIYWNRLLKLFIGQWIFLV